MAFWRELVADKTDPEGRPSKGGFRQMVAFFIGILMAVLFFILMGMGIFPKEHANTALVLILGLIGVHEVASINQKVQDTRVKTMALQSTTSASQTTTTHTTLTPKAQTPAPTNPLPAPTNPLPAPPPRQPRKNLAE